MAAGVGHMHAGRGKRGLTSDDWRVIPWPIAGLMALRAVDLLYVIDDMRRCRERLEHVALNRLIGR
jgi:hypothetical protein